MIFFRLIHRAITLGAAIFACWWLTRRFGPWQAVAIWAAAMAVVCTGAAVLLRTSGVGKITWKNRVAGYLLQWGYSIGRGKLVPIAITSWAVWTLLGIGIALQFGQSVAIAPATTLPAAAPSFPAGGVWPTLLFIAWAVDVGALLYLLGVFMKNFTPGSQAGRSVLTMMVIVLALLIGSLALFLAGQTRTAVLVAGGPPFGLGAIYGIFLLAVIVTVGKKGIGTEKFPVYLSIRGDNRVMASRFCQKCGYDLRASERQCPECGRVFDPENPRTFRRYPPSTILRRLRRFAACLLLIAVAYAGFLLWVWSGWKREQRHIQALVRIDGGATFRQAPLVSWIPRMLPARWRYLAGRVESIHFPTVGGESGSDPTHGSGWIISFAPGTDANLPLALAEIGGLSALREISFNLAQLKEEELAMLKDLPRLEKLSCWSIADTTDADVALARLRKNVSFSLTNSRITDDGLRRLIDATALQHLNLESSNITATGLHYLAEKTSLKSLILTGAQIGDMSLRDIATMTNLYCLSLDSTKITGAGLKQLAGLGSLTQLFIDCQEINDEDLTALSGFTKLTRLRISNALIHSEALRPLAGFAQLNELSLPGTRIMPGGLRHLSAMASLQSLDLSSTKISPEAFASFGSPVLHRLNLSDTSVSNDDLKSFSRFPDLRWLYLNHTRVTDAGLVFLEQSRIDNLTAEGSAISSAALQRFNDRPILIRPAD